LDYYRPTCSEATTTCLTATVESLGQYLPLHHEHQPYPTITSKIITQDAGSRDKKCIEALDRYNKLVKKSRTSGPSTPNKDHFQPSEQPNYNDTNFYTSQPTSHTNNYVDKYTIHTDSTDAITLAKDVVENKEAVAKLLRLESHAIQISNICKYLLTCILRLYSEELKLGPKKRQAKVSVLCRWFRCPNFYLVYEIDGRE
jgi:hypothetical protein